MLFELISTAKLHMFHFQNVNSSLTESESNRRNKSPLRQVSTMRSQSVHKWIDDTVKSATWRLMIVSRKTEPSMLFSLAGTKTIFLLPSKYQIRQSTTSIAATAAIRCTSWSLPTHCRQESLKPNLRKAGKSVGGVLEAFCWKHVYPDKQTSQL